MPSGTGLWNPESFWNLEFGKSFSWNPESWALESGIHLKECPDPPNDWKFHYQRIPNCVPGIQNPESRIHCVEFRIQDYLGFLYMSDKMKQILMDTVGTHR